ncbi:DUF294 nucleotidyltransferase-like domain-containing protein [Azospirillum sp. Marseille-Q6669]
MSLALRNIEECRLYSEKRLEQLRSDIAPLLDGANFIIGTNGSYARREASGQSDLDFFIVCEKEADVKAVEDRMALVKPQIRKVVGKEASKDGAFGRVESLDVMLKNIGGNDDDNKKFTRRMLYLLEGEWLYNEEMFKHVRKRLIHTYIRDGINDHQLALFLLNDIIRYYRTICVDFEFKTHESTKEWGTRNIKLVFSRKLLYFSGVLAIAETYRKTAEDKRDTLEALFEMPVIERVRHICGDRAEQALALYDDFLGDFSKAEVREECDKVTEGQRNNSQLYRRLKNKGHEFSGRLMNVLKNNYDDGHPIFRSLAL